MMPNDPVKIVNWVPELANPLDADSVSVSIGADGRIQSVIAHVNGQNVELSGSQLALAKTQLQRLIGGLSAQSLAGITGSDFTPSISDSSLTIGFDSGGNLVLSGRSVRTIYYDPRTKQAIYAVEVGTDDGRVVSRDFAFDPQFGLAPKNIIRIVDGNVEVVSEPDKPTTIRVLGNPTGVDFIDAAETLGSVFGRYLIKGDELVQTISSATIKTLGANLGDLLNTAVFDGGADTLKNMSAALNGMDGEFLDNLKESGAGALSSYLAAELVDFVGLDGFAAGALDSLAGAALNKIIANLGEMALGNNEVTSAFQGLDLAQLGNVAGSFIGNELGNAIGDWDEIGEQLGASIGGSLAGLAGGSLLSGQFFTIAGTLIPLPIVGTIIGSLLGNLLGGLIGGVFTGTPKSGAIVEYDAASGLFGVDQVWKEDGGKKLVAQQLGQAASDTLNEVIFDIGGELTNGNDVDAGSYGMRGKRYVYWEDGTASENRTKFETPSDLLEYGTLNALSQFQFLGGDVYAKRAFYNTLSQAGLIGSKLETGGDPETVPGQLYDSDPITTVDFGLDTLLGNMTLVDRLHVYLGSSASIDALIAAEPDSGFAAEWMLAFSRMNELGLWRRSSYDWDGGFSYLLDKADVDARDVQFSYDLFEDGLNGERKTFLGGSELADTIDSRSKNVVVGGVDGERMTAEAADDQSSNVFHGGAGDDEILASATGDDLFGEADDDRLIGGALDDWIFGGAGDDVLDSGGGSGNLLSGDEGDDQLVGREGSDWLVGGAGQDRLSGGAGDDILEGGSGDDLLNGGQGNDTYVYRADDGHDRLVDSGTVSSDGDRLEFDWKVFPDAVTVVARSSGEALSLYFDDPASDNEIELKGQSFGLQTGVEQVSFYDALWFRSDLTTRAVLAKTGGSTISGTADRDDLNGTIYDDALSGATGNDLLAGGGGSDQYFFNLGDGVDTLVEHGFSTDLDTLVFGAGITAANVAIGYAPTNRSDLVITVGAYGDQVILKDQLSPTGSNSIEQMLFADGTSWTLRDLLARVPASPPTADADVISGTYSVDVISSGNGNDSITGGLGDDSIDGGSGLDTYYYSAGDGNDRIYDSTFRQASGNTLILGPGILPTDVVLKRDFADSNNLILSFANSGQSILLDDQFSTAQYGSDLYDYGMETIGFADGSNWSRATIMSQMLSQASTERADYIQGSRFADAINSGVGADQVFGGGGADSITGGTGDDSIDGGSGSDTYYYAIGDGNDRIIDSRFRENSSTNTLVLGPEITAADLKIERDLADSNNVIVTFGNASGSLLLDDQMYTGQYGSALYDDGIDVILFADNSQLVRSQLIAMLLDQSETSDGDVIQGSRSEDSVDGGDGNDIISAGDGDDILTGGAGDDSLDGGSGSDTYHYSLGDGDDRIYDSRFREASLNTLIFGLGISAEDLKIEYDWADVSNLIVRIAGQSGSLVLDDQMHTGQYASSLYDDGIDVFQFSDGSQLTRAEFSAQLIATNSTYSGDYIIGTRFSDIIQSGHGGDMISSADGDDLLTGGLGDDNVDGGYGTDTYYYFSGDGHDRIYDYSYKDSQYNALVLGQGLGPSDVVLERDYSDPNNVRLYFGDTAGSILLDDELLISYTLQGTPYRNGIGVIQFADGTTWDRAQIDAAVVSATNSMSGTTGIDVLAGTAGRDDIYGNAGNDTLRGGAGSDYLRGGDGSDIYEYNLGDGFDTILEATGTDTVRFGTDINPTDLVLSRPQQDGNAAGIIIAVGGTDDRLYIKTSTTIERYEFADGTVWTEADMRTQLYAQLTTAGSDVINGSTLDETLTGAGGNDILSAGAGNDTLDGGTGDDLLQGGDGNDLYLFGRGSGRDVLVEATGTDTVRFGANIAPSDLVISRPLADNDTAGVMLQISGTEDVLYVKAATVIERYEFADGTVWAEADMRNALYAQESTDGSDIINGTTLNESLVGSAGADRLYANAGNDTVAGGIGDDYLDGGAGNDQYLFNLGDGRDVLSDASGTDTVTFGEGLSLDDLTVTRPLADGDITGLMLTFTSGDQLYVKNAVSIEQYLFADGTALTEAQMRDRYLSQARSEGSDVINGSSLADTIRGGGGDDQLLGNAGNDVLDGGRGDDLLNGGAGNDNFIFNRGDGRDVFVDSSGTDTLSFGPGITLGDLVVTRPIQDGDTTGLVIGLKDTQDRVYQKNSVMIENFAFTDGTVLSAAQIMALLAGTMIGGAASPVTMGDDVIFGSSQADTFQGLAGDDVIRGGMGSDTYRFSLGDGYDTIFDPVSDADTDTLLLSNIASTAVRVVTAPADADDVVILIDDNNQIYLDQEKIGSSGGIDSVQFSDGVTWTRQELLDHSNNMETSGADSLTGTNFADTLNGGAGNDLLTGMAGGDTYTYNVGDGDDAIVEGGSEASEAGESMGPTDDRIVFGAGIAHPDIILTHGTAENDVLLTFSTGPGSINLVGQNSGSGAGVEFLIFGDGSSVSMGTMLAQAAAAAATSGDDTIRGFFTADDLDGGLGNDLLEGGAGSDSYHFGLGSGVDDIVDDGSSADELDQLILGTGVAPSDIILRRSADAINDLVLSFRGTADEIRLTGQLASPTQGIEGVTFADGTAWSRADLLQQYLSHPATEGADYILGSDDDETMDGVGGDDIIDGGKGNDALSGGDGNDKIYGGNGDDILAGGAGDDLLSGGIGIDQFDGGDGFDTLDLSFSLDNWSVDLATGVSAITTSGTPARQESFLSIEGVVGGAGADVINGDDGDNRIDGGANSDTLASGDGNDTFIFTGSDTGLDTVDGGVGADRIEAAEDDTIIGLASLSGIEQIDGTGFARVLVTGTDNADALDLGNVEVTDISQIYMAAGNDVLVGSAASDVVNLGLGDDIYRTSGDRPADSVTGGDGTDRIEATADNTVIRLSAITGVEQITANGHSGVIIAGTDAAETFNFSSATLTGIGRIDAGDGNDVVTGSAAADVIRGGAGNDTLSGGVGDDVFEVVSDLDGIDTIDGGAGVDRIQVTTSGATIRLAAPTVGVEQIVGMNSALFYGALNDSINLSAVTLTGITSINGGAGNDTIVATAGADTIFGGTGNDTLTGNGGNDTYVYNLGDGQDIVLEHASSGGGTDSLVFGDGISPDDVRITKSGNDVILTHLPSGGSVTIKSEAGTTSAYWVEEVHFADGTVWDRTALIGTPVYGTSGPDAMSGTAAADVMFGLQSNDTVSGLAGADRLYGGAGDDILDGGTENDYLSGGDGNDTFLPGAGVDTVESGAGTDLVDYSTLTGLNMYVDLGLSDKQARFGDGSFEVWHNVESALAGSGADQLVGTDDANHLAGGDGIDRLEGRGGADTLEGQSGDDLLIGEDGADTLYGGDGNDQLSGDGYDASGPNLLVNGGFETPGSSPVTKSWGLSVATVPGWSKTNTSDFELYTSGQVSVASTEGTRWLDLDGAGTGGNMNISQSVTGRTAGEMLELKFDAANRTIAASGSFQVTWNGTMIATINATGVEMRTYTYQVAAIAGTNTLGFVSTGTVDGSGASLDNVRLTATTSASGNDLLDGGAGTDADVLRGLSSGYQLVTTGGAITVVDTDTTTDGDDGIDTVIGIETLQFKDGQTTSISSPVVLDLDGNGVTLINRAASAVTFDWDGNGSADRTGWISAGDAFLALDRDANGTLSGGSELSFVDDLPGAKSDLAGLAAFDSNADGVLSHADNDWSAFHVWKDTDVDGHVDAGEWLSLQQAGVMSLSLAGTPTEQSWGWGDNVVINSGHFTRPDGTTAAISDVALSYGNDLRITDPVVGGVESMPSKEHQYMTRRLFLGESARTAAKPRFVFKFAWLGSRLEIADPDNALSRITRLALGDIPSKAMQVPAASLTRSTSAAVNETATNTVGAADAYLIDRLTLRPEIEAQTSRPGHPRNLLGLYQDPVRLSVGALAQQLVEATSTFSVESAFTPGLHLHNQDLPTTPVLAASRLMDA